MISEILILRRTVNQKLNDQLISWPTNWLVTRDMSCRQTLEETMPGRRLSCRRRWNFVKMLQKELNGTPPVVSTVDFWLRGPRFSGYLCQFYSQMPIHLHLYPEFPKSQVAPKVGYESIQRKSNPTTIRIWGIMADSSDRFTECNFQLHYCCRSRQVWLI